MLCLSTTPLIFTMIIFVPLLLLLLPLKNSTPTISIHYKALSGIYDYYYYYEFPRRKEGERAHGVIYKSEIIKSCKIYIYKYEMHVQPPTDCSLANFGGSALQFFRYIIVTFCSSLSLSLSLSLSISLSLSLSISLLAFSFRTMKIINKQRIRSNWVIGIIIINWPTIAKQIQITYIYIYKNSRRHTHKSQSQRKVRNCNDIIKNDEINKKICISYKKKVASWPWLIDWFDLIWFDRIKS